MEKYIFTKAEIEATEGLSKTHFLNRNARRLNKPLGDWTGLKGLGFHLIEVEPGCESTEYHVHHFEEECVYILEGEATVTIGGEQHKVCAGDFIGYRAGGEPHTMYNHGTETLKCIVAGQRLPHDVTDYPRQGKRLYRGQGQWDLVDTAHISHPQAGKKG